MYLKLFYAIKVSILGTKNSVFPILPPHFAHWVGFKCCYPITGKMFVHFHCYSDTEFILYESFSFHVFHLEGKCVNFVFMPKITLKSIEHFIVHMIIMWAGCYQIWIWLTLEILTDVVGFEMSRNFDMDATVETVGGKLYGKNFSKSSQYILPITVKCHESMNIWKEVERIACTQTPARPLTNCTFHSHVDIVYSGTHFWENFSCSVHSTRVQGNPVYLCDENISTAFDFPTTCVCFLSLLLFIFHEFFLFSIFKSYFERQSNVSFFLLLENYF